MWARAARLLLHHLIMSLALVLTFFGRGDLRLWRQRVEARITSWLLQIGYAHRTELARHVSLLLLLQTLLQLARSVRGVSSACCSPWPSPVVPRHRYPSHRRPRRPPPAKCRGNEVGAKMTGSISDFWSGTYASVAVPRELALIVLRSAAERIGPKPRSVS